MYFTGKLISGYDGPGNLMLMAMNDREKPTQAELQCGQEKLDHQMRHK